MKTLIVAAFVAVFFVSQAIAQPQCAPRAQVEYVLAGKYGERLQDEQMRDGIYLQVWANTESGSWSFVATDGRTSCLFTAGSDYNGETVDDIIIGLRGEPA